MMGSGDVAMPMEDSPARISKIRAGTRMPPKPAAVTRWQPPTSSRAPVITHRFPLTEADAAIAAIKSGEAGKVIFEIA